MYQPFFVQGVFQGFEPHPKGKLKIMTLLTEQGVLRIKLDKPLRRTLGPSLQRGQHLQVQGMTKIKLGGESKIVAERIHIVTPTDAILEKAASDSQLPWKRCIQVCGKSDCRRRGGSRVLEELDHQLAEHPDQETIRIKVTGCMKNCKAGPNLVVMPDKARYCQITPAQVPDLLRRHFPPASEDPHRTANTVAADQDQR